MGIRTRRQSQPTAATDIDAIKLEIMWQQLIGIADEAVQALIQTSYSNVVREAKDVQVILLDTAGRLVVQSNLGLPSFAFSLPHAAREILRDLRRAPRHGDVFLTNDPWLATGHLNDLCLFTPLYHRSRVIGYVASAAHTADIGGGTSPTGIREIYEEGLRIPPVPLVSAGRDNEAVWDMIAANVRLPVEVHGDLRAQLVALSTVTTRLQEFLKEHELVELDLLARLVMERAEHAMRQQIEQLLPDGDYYDEVRTDGFDHPLVLRMKIAVRGDEVHVDFDGSSPQVDKGINSSLTYTTSYVAFALKCILDPFIPNNDGCFRPITVTAPPGSILNCDRSSPVRHRGRTGQYIPGMVFHALAEAIPAHVMAESSQPVWTHTFFGEDGDHRKYAFSAFLNGGMGARPNKDGICCLGFPVPVGNTPIEILENLVPLVVHEKRLLADSGGAGRFRGGCGQRITLELVEGTARATLHHERTSAAPRGIQGGLPGTPGCNFLDGLVVPGKSEQLMGVGSRITFELPGGGGFGPPTERDIDAVLRDVVNGYVTAEAARRVYGVALEHRTGRWSVDEEATRMVRQAATLGLT